MQINPKTTISATSNQVSSQLVGEAVILNIDTGIYYGLNSVSSTIWEHIQTTRTFAEVVEKVLQEYAVEREQCQTDIQQILVSMQGAGLVTITEPLS